MLLLAGLLQHLSLLVLLPLTANPEGRLTDLTMPKLTDDFNRKYKVKSTGKDMCPHFAQDVTPNE